MMLHCIPKLPYRNKWATKEFYLQALGFKVLGDYPNYLIMGLDEIEIHFFEYKELNPTENYGQIYIRMNGIDAFYHDLIQKNIALHPNGALENKAWNQREFSLLDPDYNLITFGQSLV